MNRSENDAWAAAIRLMEDARVARRIIRRAEKDLGPLPQGQRVDLLADNSDWSLPYIRKILTAANMQEKL